MLDSIVLIFIYPLIFVIPGLATAVRRLYDIGKSGWYVLVSLVPFVGSIWLLVLLCQKGETQDVKVKAQAIDYVTYAIATFLPIAFFVSVLSKGDNAEKFNKYMDGVYENTLSKDDSRGDEATAKKAATFMPDVIEDVVFPEGYEKVEINEHSTEGLYYFLIHEKESECYKPVIFREDVAAEMITAFDFSNIDLTKVGLDKEMGIMECRITEDKIFIRAFNGSNPSGYFLDDLFSFDLNTHVLKYIATGHIDFTTKGAVITRYNFSIPDDKGTSEFYKWEDLK